MLRFCSVFDLCGAMLLLGLQDAKIGTSVFYFGELYCRLGSYILENAVFVFIFGQDQNNMIDLACVCADMACNLTTLFTRLERTDR